MEAGVLEYHLGSFRSILLSSPKKESSAFDCACALVHSPFQLPHPSVPYRLMRLSTVMPHPPVLGDTWVKGGDLPYFLLQRPHPWGHISMSNPLPTPDVNPTPNPHVIIQLPHPWGRIFKTNPPPRPPVSPRTGGVGHNIDRCITRQQLTYCTSSVADFLE